jgi:hypothetical protein
MATLPTLPRPLEEWVEIKVGLEGAHGWIGGIYLPAGAKWRRFGHISFCPRNVAITMGKCIADRASVARLLVNLPPCKFTVDP